MSTWHPSEAELAVLGALEARPRASWTEVGAALGIAATTAARHWASLSRHRAAWVTVGPGPVFIAPTSFAFVLLAVAPPHRDVVLTSVCTLPTVATVSITGGHWYLLMDCFAPTHRELTDVIESFTTLPGVSDIDVMPALATYRNGATWRSGTISAIQLSHLIGERTHDRRVSVQPDSLDRALLKVLSKDGRTSWLRLARACNISPQTAKRRVTRLLHGGYASIRCDSMLHARGPRHEVTLLLNVPLGSLDDVIMLLANRADCRLVARTLARGNVLSTLWLRNIDDISAVERSIARIAPQTVLVAQLVNFHTMKRAGHILDRSGRWTDIIPTTL